jgi:hypothetical protein
LFRVVKEYDEIKADKWLQKGCPPKKSLSIQTVNCLDRTRLSGESGPEVEIVL